MLSARTYRQIGPIVGELAESGLAKDTDDMPMPRMWLAEALQRPESPQINWGHLFGLGEN